MEGDGERLGAEGSCECHLLPGVGSMVKARSRKGVDRWKMVAFLCDMGETVAERLGKVSEWGGE